MEGGGVPDEAVADVQSMMWGMTCDEVGNAYCETRLCLVIVEFLLIWYKF